MPAPVATFLSNTRGHSSSARSVTMRVTNVANLGGVLVGTTAMTDVVVLDAQTIRFTMPIGPSYQPGTLPISLVGLSDGVVHPTRFSFTWFATDAIDKQMAYAFTHWNLYRSARFGYISDNDCANFASQTLLARGWRMTSAWFNDGQSDWGSAWVSSTALGKWLYGQRSRVTHLTYAQRSKVAIGDIVQFNWNAKANPGVWLHTAIVSKVVVLPDGSTDVYYTAHTNNAQYGGSTNMLIKYGSKYLKIQFWHVR